MTTEINFIDSYTLRDKGHYHIYTTAIWNITALGKSTTSPYSNQSSIAHGIDHPLIAVP